LANLSSAVIASFVIVAIILGVAAGYFLIPRISTTTIEITVVTSSISTTTTTSETTITGSTMVAPSVELAASVLPINPTPGENISISADVYNPLVYTVMLNATSIVNPAYGPCAQNQATSIDVYSGHYTFSNISEGAPLLLYNASQLFLCPAQFHFTYSFNPNSDNATIVTLPPFSLPTVSKIVNETSIVSGYWTKSGNSYAFQHFDPGQYSVLVTDAWSQETICYFQVS